MWFLFWKNKKVSAVNLYTWSPQLRVNDNQGLGLATRGPTYLTPDAKTGGVPNPNVKKRNHARRPWYEHLTGYVGRLRRMENEEWKDSKNIIKKEDAKEAKISFLRRFYPKVSHSPGGSVRSD